VNGCADASNIAISTATNGELERDSAGHKAGCASGATGNKGAGPGGEIPGRRSNQKGIKTMAYGTNGADGATAKTTWSWRDVLKIHPAAELFPLMTEAALHELAEDIKTNGLCAPFVGWGRDGQSLLDGRNRLDAMALLGLLYETDDHHVGVKKWTGKQWSDQPGGRLGYEFEFTNFYDGDPYAIVLSLNLHRRHLTAEQKRDVIVKFLAAKPELSNRQIAAELKVDHKKVGAVRRDGEATGAIPPVEKTVGKDGKARPVKVKKKSISTTVPPASIMAATDIEPASKAGTTIELGSAIEREWSEAERAFEALTSRTVAQVATAISPGKAALVTEFADFFAELKARLTTRPNGNDEAPAAGSDYSIPDDDLSIPHFLQRGAVS
jgi:hypothetical protein